MTTGALAHTSRTATWRPTGRSAAPYIFTIAALAAWWGYAQILPPYQIPGPVPVVSRMADFIVDPWLGSQLLISLIHVLASITIAFVVGAILAFSARYLSLTRLLVDARLTPFLNAFPGIAWLFLAMLWFGVNSVTVVFSVTMTLIPFAVINLRTGLDELDHDLVELGRSLTRKRLLFLRKLFVPMLVPYVFATLRTSFGVAWKVVLTAELFGGNAGVGYILNTARLQFDTETIFAIILFILLFVAMVETFAFRPVQRMVDRRYGGA